MGYSDIGTLARTRISLSLLCEAKSRAKNTTWLVTLHQSHLIRYTSQKDSGTTHQRKTKARVHGWTFDFESKRRGTHTKTGRRYANTTIERNLYHFSVFIPCRHPEEDKRHGRRGIPGAQAFLLMFQILQKNFKHKSSRISK